MSKDGNIVVTDDVHKAAALFMPTFASRRAVLGQVRFLGWETEWNVPEPTGEGLSLTTVFPKASHKQPI